MRVLRVFLGVTILFLAGITVGGLLCQDEVIPPWLIPLFLLPAAIYLDHFFSHGTYSWKIRKYSTTVGVICVTLIGFLLTEFEAFRTFSWVVLVLVFLVPIFFAPEILCYLLGSVFLNSEDDPRKKTR